MREMAQKFDGSFAHILPEQGEQNKEWVGELFVSKDSPPGSGQWIELKFAAKDTSKHGSSAIELFWNDPSQPARMKIVINQSKRFWKREGRILDEDFELVKSILEYSGQPHSQDAYDSLIWRLGKRVAESIHQGTLKSCFDRLEVRRLKIQKMGDCEFWDNYWSEIEGKLLNIISRLVASEVACNPPRLPDRKLILDKYNEEHWGERKTRKGNPLEDKNLRPILERLGLDWL